MSKTYKLDQMKLFCDIAAAISKQQPRMPADNRANVAIEAANMIVAAYALTDAEYMEKKSEAPISVDLQPTEEQIEAGRKALWEQIPGALDGLYEQMEEEGVDELLSDTVVFTWQAMIGARAK